MLKDLKDLHLTVQFTIIVAVMVVLIIMVLNPTGAKSVIELVMTLSALLGKGGGVSGIGGK